MTTLNPFPNRYRPLQTNLTDTAALINDTEASVQQMSEILRNERRSSRNLKERIAGTTKSILPIRTNDQ
ncbi:hypothetical protein IMF27_10925 [Pseudomonas sp. PCH199]|uniref:hypothetical protein n=1 Tax=unclassified Pseudomonas TaxID=196821 RepID=UPI000BD8C308|nr:MULTISPECIES: hypothetical protein [unclassified Pseudomonas]MCW8276139.1 hypothetical protein [Pseudomonas sp. PCH199]PAM83529.1 hypothetical protein CES87_11190 [Pseudomonas sp. ERMR1:02]